MIDFSVVIFSFIFYFNLFFFIRLILLFLFFENFSIHQSMRLYFVLQFGKKNSFQFFFPNQLFDFFKFYFYLK